MTADEKRDRRQAKHELADQFRRLAIRRLGLYSTGPQIRAAVKTLVDAEICRQMVAKT